MWPDRRPEPRKARPGAFFPPYVPGKTKSEVRGPWGVVLAIDFRTAIALSVVAAAAFAGSSGSAAAQYYYPPQPGAYQPPYADHPVYRDADGAPLAEDAYGRLYAPQPMPTQDGQTLARPPAAVGGGDPADVTGSISAPAAPPQAQPNRATVVASLPPEEQPDQSPANLPPQFRRQIVDYNTIEPAGTIIIDTAHTYLYLILAGGKAMRYGIGVGREGFTWSGTERISRMKEWPDWFPPKEMIERQPYLPRFMAGGETNPLGARAMYLGNTLYRIHGTNQPSTIGTYVSSGCIRLTNEDVEDLYSRVTVGTRVVVLPNAQASAAPPVAPR
jgi:lipoprotein-anchoring transpeptidase ErfK/SrfK